MNGDEIRAAAVEAVSRVYQGAGAREDLTPNMRKSLTAEMLHQAKAVTEFIAWGRVL